MKYNFWKGLGKSLVSFGIFALPFAVQMLPETWMNLTVGGLLALIVNFLKVKAKEAEML